MILFVGYLMSRSPLKGTGSISTSQVVYSESLTFLINCFFLTSLKKGWFKASFADILTSWLYSSIFSSKSTRLSASLKFVNRLLRSFFWQFERSEKIFGSKGTCVYKQIILHFICSRNLSNPRGKNQKAIDIPFVPRRRRPPGREIP